MIEDKRSYWNKRFSAEGEIWGGSPSETCVRAADSFKQFGVKTVLVPGCGYGRHSDYLSQMGFEVLGFDVSDVVITLAANKRSTNTRYMNMDVLELSGLSKKFDAVYSFNLIHLFRESERRQILESFRCHLNGPGVLAFTVFSTDDVDFGKGEQIECNTYEAKPCRPTHFYTSEELMDILKDWEIIEIVAHSEHEEHGKGPHIHSLLYCACKLKEGK